MLAFKNGFVQDIYHFFWWTEDLYYLGKQKYIEVSKICTSTCSWWLLRIWTSAITKFAGYSLRIFVLVAFVDIIFITKDGGSRNICWSSSMSLAKSANVSAALFAPLKTCVKVEHRIWFSSHVQSSTRSLYFRLSFKDNSLIEVRESVSTSGLIFQVLAMWSPLNAIILLEVCLASKLWH